MKRGYAWGRVASAQIKWVSLGGVMGVVCMVVVRISMKPMEMWNVGIRILVTGAADVSVILVGGCSVINCWTELEAKCGCGSGNWAGASVD